MSELINTNDNRATIRWKLLTGASALALTVSSANVAKAEDTSRPQIWIELGGQLSQLEDGQEAFDPVFPDSPPRPTIFEPSQKFEKPPRVSIDEYGEISFQPEDSNWVFSASIRYGRSKSARHYLQQTNPLPTTKYLSGHRYVRYPLAQRFAETNARTSEQHAILDFQVGKDVGLGLFGSRNGSSSISFGVRFAQFRGTSDFSLKSDPDWHFTPQYIDLPPVAYHVKEIRQAFHSNLASMTAQRSFRGVGPSVSWKSSVPIAGSVQDGEIGVDWGINGAILFGRQRARTHHQSTARYVPGTKYANQIGQAPKTISRLPATPDHARSHNVTVPNVGGSVGLSWRLQDFKVSMGYRSDFFFGAMDGGIDARKSQNVGFNGPYASISVGVGD